MLVVLRVAEAGRSRAGSFERSSRAEAAPKIHGSWPVHPSAGAKLLE